MRRRRLGSQLLCAALRAFRVCARHRSRTGWPSVMTRLSPQAGVRQPCNLNDFYGQTGRLQVIIASVTVTGERKRLQSASAKCLNPRGKERCSTMARGAKCTCWPSKGAGRSATGNRWSTDISLLRRKCYFCFTRILRLYHFLIGLYLAAEPGENRGIINVYICCFYL